MNDPNELELAEVSDMVRNGPWVHFASVKV